MTPRTTPQHRSRRRTRRLVAATAAAAALGLGLPALTSAAGAAVVLPADAQHVTEVTVFLKAPHPAALAALASAHGLSRAQRLHALASLVPAAATHDDVARELAAAGLHVESQTAWSLTASGSTTAIAAAFGTRPKLPAGAGRAAYLAATSNLPALPSALADDVSGVFPTTAGPAVLHHATTDTLAGADFRNADTPAGVTPSTGKNDAQTTIATVQFADFNSNGVSNAAASDTAADLTAYAKEHGLADPVAGGQYKAVHVDGGPSQTDDAMGGDVEVDLDQEAILSTAPSAKQHPYFAPNTDAGFGDIFAAVYDDVTGNKDATSPDPHITALSSSWGECESATGSAAITSVEPVLESLVAAGVTVFSASGDDGIYDCRSQTGTGLDNSQADVDYPGSSPVVVSVGGTNLSAATSAPNTGTNWTEKAWSCTDATTCQATNVPTVGTGGSGGGASGSAYSASTSGSFAGFPAPSYQKTDLTNAPFAGAKTRLVPDISADGDPSTGFDVYTSNPQYVLEGGGSNDIQVGGTSLATPISAAQFDNALADSGRTSGVGDIHGALYTAYARTKGLKATDPAKVFRDVTSGTNGADGDKGSDPSVSAASGYDTVSGLGGVLWSALMPYLGGSDSGSGSGGKPAVTATLALPRPHRPAGTNAVKGSWTALKARDTHAIAHTVVTAFQYGHRAHPLYKTTSTASSGTFRFAAKPGRTYRIRVTATDSAGVSSTAKSTLVVPIDDGRFRFSTGWKRVTGARDFGGSHASGTKRSSTATVRTGGRTFTLNVLTGRTHGELGVYVSGELIATIDEYSAHGARRSFTFLTTKAIGLHTFVFRPLGRKAHASHGYVVDVDSLTVRQ